MGHLSQFIVRAKPMLILVVGLFFLGLSQPPSSFPSSVLLFVTILDCESLVAKTCVFILCSVPCTQMVLNNLTDTHCYRTHLFFSDLFLRFSFISSSVAF